MLIVLAAILHAGWNGLSKHRQPSVTFFLIASLSGSVLLSLAFVSNVSYVAAFRQLSIPLGVLYGITILKEPVRIPQIAGTALIVCGLVLAAIL